MDKLTYYAPNFFKWGARTQNHSKVKEMYQKFDQCLPTPPTMRSLPINKRKSVTLSTTNTLKVKQILYKNRTKVERCLYEHLLQPNMYFSLLNAPYNLIKQKYHLGYTTFHLYFLAYIKHFYQVFMNRFWFNLCYPLVSKNWGFRKNNWAACPFF